MKVKCPNCRYEIEVDEALKSQWTAQISKIKADAEKEAEGKIKEAENRVKEQVKAEASKEARDFYEQTVKDLKNIITKNSEENKELYEKLQTAELARIEADKLAQKKILEDTDRIYKEAKAKADEENKLKLEEQNLLLEQTKEALKRAKDTAERGSQQIQGEALEKLVEKDLRDECRLDKIETVKTGARGADIKQEVSNNRGENCGLILWEIKNAKWQDGWIEKFKEDIAVEKASVGVIVVQDLPERFCELGTPDERVFAIKPRTVKLLAALLRSKIIEIYDIGNDRKFSSQNIEAFYNYLTSGDFKARLLSITETYQKLRELHNKDKMATQRRWGEYEKQLDKMERGAYTFVGELQGISNGEIGDIPLLNEGASNDSDETA